MKKSTLLYFLFAAICFAAGAQNKSNYNVEALDLGDGKVSMSKQKETNDFVLQEFIVEVRSTGEYYLAAWVNVGADGRGKTEYFIQINDEEAIYKIEAREANPHAIDLGETRIFLKSGSNSIVFKTRKPICPNVEFITVSLDKEKSSISSKNYTTYIEELSRQKLPENYASIKKAAKEAELANANLKSYKLDNPQGNYEHEMDLDFGYTFYEEIYLNSGNTYTFEIRNATSDPVLQLFNVETPSQYSWTDDDGGDGYNSKITASITMSGLYFILIRKFINPSSVVGTCDLYLDNSLYASNCAVSGSGIRCDISVSETLNWFTASLSGDSRIWIEEDQGESPGRIINYNDDYSSLGDFSWGTASRVKANLNTSIRAVIVSCFSSYTPTGNCDLYMNCKNGTVESIFPILDADDAIQSAPASSSYNCISWSGGITNVKHWPPDPLYGGVYYVNNNPLGSFDNFYGNVPSVRYAGAMSYSRSGANVSNSVIDLWYNPNFPFPGWGDYTHASVKKPGNNHPHGYDWESKTGNEMRIFHPRNSLNNTASDGYGAVSNYYIPSSSLKSAMLLDESIARGLSVIENVELTAAEKNTVSESISALTANQRSQLEIKYYAWKQTWEKPEIAIHSNPRMYANSKEYDEFINYCKGQGKDVWPFVFDKIQQGDFFAINALRDLTLTENQNVLDKVKKECILKSTTESGTAIIRSPQTYAMKYIKELLRSSNSSKELLKSFNSGTFIDDGISYSNSFDFKVYPNPAKTTSQLSFNLPNDANISAELNDLNGRVLSIVIDRQHLKAGNYTYKLNVPENFSGTCLVKLWVNNNVNVQLIVVQ